MTVRIATIEDIPTIVEMGRRFHAASGYASIVAYDPQSAANTFASIMENPDGVLLVAVQDGEICGTAAAMSYPFYFNVHHKTGNEFFWWVNPEFRGTNVGRELLDALEMWKDSMNAGSFTVSALESMRPEIVGEIYRRRGYVPSDRSFIKASQRFN